MNARVAAWVGAIIFLIAIALLFLVFLNLLPLLILAIGIVVFVVLVAGLIVSALLMIFAIPYYFITKPAEVQPGSVTLEQLKER